MYSTAARLLQAALEIVGSEKELARRLGIGETLLGKFMTDLVRLPDPLFLRAVDIVLAQRQLTSLPREFALRDESSEESEP